MTYKNSHNDPTRNQKSLSPEEVQAMITGGSAATGGDRATAEMQRDMAERDVMWTDHDGLRILDMPHTLGVFKDDYGNPALRCPPCGRADDCACGDGCIYCIAGTPRRAFEKDLYAPTSR